MNKDQSAREAILAKVRSAARSLRGNAPGAARLGPFRTQNRGRPGRRDGSAAGRGPPAQRPRPEGAGAGGVRRCARGTGEGGGRPEGVVQRSPPLSPVRPRRVCWHASGWRSSPPASDRRRLAECDLGMTVADGALPETGTVLLRTTKGQPDLLSLLPRVHLALVSPRCPAAGPPSRFCPGQGGSPLRPGQRFKPNRGHRKGPHPRRPRPQILPSVDLLLKSRAGSSPFNRACPGASGSAGPSPASPLRSTPPPG